MSIVIKIFAVKHSNGSIWLEVGELSSPDLVVLASRIVVFPDDFKRIEEELSVPCTQNAQTN